MTRNRLQNWLDGVIDFSSPDNALFNCDMCGWLRISPRISVHKVDTSEKHGLPIGTVVRNLKYCNDNESCKAALVNYVGENAE